MYNQNQLTRKLDDQTGITFKKATDSIRVDNALGKDNIKFDDIKDIGDERNNYISL